MSTTDEQTKFLTIYLEDHVAGATAGSRRAARLADAEAESTDAAALKKFAEDVAADLDALLAMMVTLEVEPSRLKVGLASTADDQLEVLSALRAGRVANTFSLHPSWPSGAADVRV